MAALCDRQGEKAIIKRVSSCDENRFRHAVISLFYGSLPKPCACPQLFLPSLLFLLPRKHLFSFTRTILKPTRSLTTHSLLPSSVLPLPLTFTPARQLFPLSRNSTTSQSALNEDTLDSLGVVGRHWRISGEEISYEWTLQCRHQRGFTGCQGNRRRIRRF